MSKSLRILHIITSLRTGGAERLMVDLLPRLKAQGYEVDLLLFDGTRTPFYQQLEEEGIRIHSLGIGAKDMYNPLWIFKLSKYFRQYDIIHTHNTPCQLLAALAKAKGEYTLITTEHNTSNRRRKWKGYRCIDRWMYGKYHRIICVSKAVEELLNDYLQSKQLAERITTIPNGIDIQRFAEAKPDEDLRKQYAGKHLIIMVAAFRLQKDQPTLIDAMKFLPADYHLLLVGDGECREDCEKQAAEGLNARIHFLGNRSDVPTLLKTADVVIMSSHYEGLSLSSIEGMASGRPFIASDVAGLHDIVGNAGLLFPQGDSEQLAQLIRKVCENVAFSNEVSQRCTQRARKYDISTMANGYIQAYQDLTKI